MTFEEISEKAFKKEKISETSNLAEKYAYLQLVDLYKDYYNGKIAKEKAAIEKHKIEFEFNDYQQRIKKYYDLYKERNENRIKYEDFIISIEKESDQTQLLIKSLQFIEMIIQDKSFFERNYAKIS